jgi:protein-tyrosine phosphatase
MTPSDVETVVVKVIGFKDQAEVGVVPLFMFVLVPMIMELLHKGFTVLVNCKKGCNRWEL